MSVNREDVGRDVSAALSDIRGRRDQAIAEYDERLRLLEKIGQELDDGELEPKAAQDRVRRLINERGGGTSRGVRAGRTQIGMRMPAEPTPSTPHGIPVRSPLGPSPTVATAAIQKALSTLDGRMVTLLTDSMADKERQEARLELALLRSVRASLTRQLETMPNDVVLLGSLIEFADDVQTTLSDLLEGGMSRVKRLLDFDRELASQLSALGGSVGGVKEQIEKARGLLGDGEKQLKTALGEALTAFDKLSGELKRRFKNAEGSILDQLL